jgi:hypothetical protein
VGFPYPAITAVLERLEKHDNEALERIIRRIMFGPPVVHLPASFLRQYHPSSD